MAARFPTPRYCIQDSRFSKQNGWRQLGISLSLNGNIAVTGHNVNTRRTYIDVYTNVSNSHSRENPKIIYSKEFEKYSDEEWIYHGRLVSFIDSYDINRGLVIVTCLGDKIQLIDLNQDQIIKSRKVALINHGEIRCLSVRERREIFISFLRSNKIIVYDVIDLNEIKSIILKGIQDGDFPDDMTVIGDRIFLFTTNGTTKKETMLIFDETNGTILSELTKPSDQLCFMRSVSANIQLGICAVVWASTYKPALEEQEKIVFYSLLSKPICSVLIVEVESGLGRIRISDRGDRMVWRNRWTLELKVYDMSEIFSYGHLKETLQSQLQEDECLKLTDFFALPDGQRDEIFKSDSPTENLLLSLEGKGVIQPYDVDRLAEAFTQLGIESTCYYLVNFYQETRTPLFYKETTQMMKEKIKVKQEEVEHIKKRLETVNIDAEENKAQVKNLQQMLQRIKQEHKKTEEVLQQTRDLQKRTALVRNKLKAECDQYKSEVSILDEKLESAKQDLLRTKEVLTKVTKEKNAIRAELEQSQLQYSIKSRSLEWSPDGDMLTGTAQANPPKGRTRSDGSVSSATSGYLQESVIEHEFSRLLVQVSEQLRSNKCVLLATYFSLPESTIGLIRKDSSTAGITLLGEMKERNIINMYDVSKLQKALEDIGLLGIIQALLKPYQEKIDPLMYTKHKATH